MGLASGITNRFRIASEQNAMRACLVVETGDASPSEWSLQGRDVIKLGRNRDNPIVLRGEHVSRFHAEIFRENGRWRLRDCGTINGTYLNGTRIVGTALLEHGCE